MLPFYSLYVVISISNIEKTFRVFKTLLLCYTVVAPCQTHTVAGNLYACKTLKAFADYCLICIINPCSLYFCSSHCSILIFFTYTNTK